MTVNKTEFDVIGVRRFHELQPGDMFKAMIHDVRQGSVTLKFNDGTTYTARSLVLPDARIGEDSIFLVRENDFKGHIVLEMVKLTDEVKQDNMLREMLSIAGMNATRENLALGRAMLEAGIPVDAGILQSGAAQRLIHEPELLTRLIRRIELACADIFPAEVRYINPARMIKPGEKPLLHYYRRLYQAARGILRHPDTPAAAFAPTRDIIEVLQFLSRFKYRRIYYQIPYITDAPRHADLHVFNRPASVSAVTTTETETLGRIETRIHLANRQAALSFQCANPQTVELLEAHFPQLTRALAQRGLSVTIRQEENAPISTPFTLLSAPPTWDDKPETLSPRRFTFDMRV